MASLSADDWYELARTTNWTPKYVTVDELFPPELSDIYSLPLSELEKFDEPYRATYREYVKTQREKDVGAYSVKAALARSKMYERADPSWKALLQLHFGSVTFVEYITVGLFARLARFGKAPGMRNMATFGCLDEIRHTQIHLYFAYELIGKDRSFDWAQKSPSTNNWVVISERHCFEDVQMTRDAITAAIMTNFSFESAFTNLQFVALSADAANCEDFSFSTMLQSVQSDEARHSQIGEPLLRIMVENGRKAEAQKLIDISFWRCWKQASALSGISMDYYTPLEHREQSFKEFIHEWVADQFVRKLLDVGIERPWYWDIFLKDVETFHHAQQIGVYLSRQTEWWHPIAGVSPPEREWLETKYPGWNDTFGRVWDVIIENVLNGRFDKTMPKITSLICNMSGLSITGIPGKNWRVEDFYLDYEGRRYHFGSEVDRWIFLQEPDRYKGHLSIIDRRFAGIMPADYEGALEYMGLSPPERGTDGTNYEWVEAYRRVAAE